MTTSNEHNNAPAVPAEIDVRTILLDIVPGDGNGQEVYARTVDDVVNNNELNGLKLEPCGEPNLYWLMRDAGWVAKIQMNGFFTVPKQEAILGAMLAAAKPADIDRDAISNALLSSLGTVYDCNRVWSAWSHGTMGPDDFVPFDSQDDRIEEVVDAIIAALRAKGGKHA